MAELIAKANLTHWQKYCIMKCLVDGWAHVTVARWHGKTRQAVTDAIRKANIKLEAIGLPPAVSRKGSRAEARKTFSGALEGNRRNAF